MIDNILINSLKYKFVLTLSTLEDIIENYPYNTLKKNKNALKYLRDLIYEFDLTYVFFNENKDINEMPNIDGKNVFTEFERNKILTKKEIKNCFDKIVVIIDNWFFQKDDEWLKLPYTYKNTTFDFIPLIDMTIESEYKSNYLDYVFNEVFSKEKPKDTNFDHTLSTLNSLDRIIGNLETMIKNKFIR